MTHHLLYILSRYISDGFIGFIKFCKGSKSVSNGQHLLCILWFCGFLGGWCALVFALIGFATGLTAWAGGLAQIAGGLSLIAGWLVLFFV